MVPPRRNLCDRAAPTAELAATDGLAPSASLLPFHEFAAALARPRLLSWLRKIGEESGLSWK